MKKQVISKSLDDTKKFAEDFANEILNLRGDSPGATIIGLYGDLGSGKTTFMKFFGEALGVKEEIKSPTFVILKRFEINELRFKNLVHIDAYRIEKEEEMLVLGWNRIISDPKNIICIEWPEKIAGLLKAHIVVKFVHAGEKEREISIA